MRVIAGIAIIIASSLAPSWGQTLQEQAICAQQAEKVFKAYNNAGSVPDYKPITSNYQSHYNTNLRKCLILVDEMSELKGEMLTTSELLDAFENRQIADYIWQTKEGKKFWEVPPLYCVLNPAGGSETNCSSRQEFDAFVSKLMAQ
jgi:hypothetical protein